MTAAWTRNMMRGAGGPRMMRRGGFGGFSPLDMLLGGFGGGLGRGFGGGLGRGFGGRGFGGGFGLPMMGLGMGAGVWQLLMAAELVREVVQLAWHPPLTLGLMAANALIFFATGRRLPLLGAWSISDCGFEPQRAALLLRVLGVAARGGSRRLRWGAARGVAVAGLAARELLRRVFVSQLMHVDLMHLYYNMTSLLWKGESTALSSELKRKRFRPGWG